MQLKLNGKSLQGALSNLKRVIGMDSATMFVKDKNIYVISSANQKTLKVLVLGEILEAKGESSFGFSISIVSSIVGNREDIIFEITESQVLVSYKSKQSKINADFVTTPPDIPRIDEENTGKSIKLEALTLSVMQQYLNNISLNPLFSNNEMELNVALSSNGLEMSMYDSYHSAYVLDPSITQTNPYVFNIPVNTFRTLSFLSGKDTYSLVLGSAFLTAKNNNFEVSLPLMQGDTITSVSTVREGLKAIKIKEEASFSIKREDIFDSLNTLSSLSDSNSFVSIKSSKVGSLNLSLKSQYGEITDKRKIKGGGDINVKFNPILLTDCLNCINAETINFGYEPNMNAFVIENLVESAKYTYLMVLIQN